MPHTLKQRSSYRPFADAQSFVRPLKLNTQKEWLCYCKGKLKGYPSKPKDIPASPQRVYKGKGWDGMRDWLGTKKITYRPFEEARSFARSLKLSSYEEWSKYCKGKLKGYLPKPKDIPASAHRVYKSKGWNGVSDWLGNGKTIWQRNGHRSFTDTRSFVRSLQLSSYEEWVKYCKGELKSYPPKPKDIPASPQRVYKGKGWDGMRDWLGTKKITYRPFTDAQSFVRSLKLSTQKEWVKYCKGGLKGYPPKPKDIPANPRRTYNGKGWKNTPDWLRNDYRPSEYRPFADARSFVRSLKLSTQKEWVKYCKGELEDYPPKPKDIPASPQRVYKGKGWNTLSDWLGSDHRSFAEARKFVRSLKLNSHKEWRRYSKGELKGYPPKSRNIPASPQQVYKGKGWVGTRNWLGTKKTTYRPFEEARNFARSLRLNTGEEWLRYCRGEMEDRPPRPKDIPKTPREVYQGKGWRGMNDWLANVAKTASLPLAWQSRLPTYHRK